MKRDKSISLQPSSKVLSHPKYLLLRKGIESVHSLFLGPKYPICAIFGLEYTVFRGFTAIYTRFYEFRQDFAVTKGLCRSSWPNLATFSSKQTKFESIQFSSSSTHNFTEDYETKLFPRKSQLQSKYCRR